ncbi:DNA primase [bacterium]|nr:DNA primase [bacterium]
MVPTLDDVILQIKNQMDIVDIVSEEVVLKKKGANYWGLCPFHGEKTPSFSVNQERGIFKCFGCGVGGDGITFLMKIHNWDYIETIKYLAEKYHIEIPKFSNENTKNRKEKELMLDACRKAVLFYQDILLSAPSDNVAVKYLNNRGITPAVISNFSLGLALKESNLLYKKLKMEFDDSILEKAGLILKSSQGRYVDRFRNRIIIPIQNESGDYVAFGARAIEEGQNPKYLNSSDSPIYNKSRILYGLYTAKESIKQEDAVIIMEGYFDVISAQANGIRNAVASCGTSLTQEHIKIFSKYTKNRRIFLSFDTDLAGQNATKRGGEIIKNAFQGLGNIKQFDESHALNDDMYACEIRVISPPEGKDPDEFIRSAGADAYKAYIKNAPLLLDFELNQLLKTKSNYVNPQEKAELVKKVVEILNEIQNPIIQSEYVKLIATQIAVDEDALKNSINTAIGPNFVIQNKNSNVTISSSIDEIAQKNLISVYFISNSPCSLKYISDRIEGVKFTNETLIIVKNTIDKLTDTVNNVSELINLLYAELADNEKAHEMITDLICISDTFRELNEKEINVIIKENIAKIESCRLDAEHKQFKQKYEEVNSDEAEALQLQMQLRDKIKKLNVGEDD